MKLDNIRTIEQMEAFLQGSQAIAFAVVSSKDERYHCVEKILNRMGYDHLKRRDKGILIKFLRTVSGYSRQQLTRMIQRYREQGALTRYQKTTNGFESFYTPKDIQLLAELDQRHDTPNGLRVKKLC